MAQIEVIGNAGSDAELKFIKGAKGEFAVANFSLAESPREYKNGEWVTGETIWWKVSATGVTAEALADVSLKGVTLIVKGDLKQFEYTGRDGVTKQGFEIRAKTIGQVLNGKRKTAPATQSGGDDAWPF
jgi:single-strand DNA-binding protein